MSLRLIIVNVGGILTRRGFRMVIHLDFIDFNFYRRQVFRNIYCFSKCVFVPPKIQENMLALFYNL